MTSKSRRAVMTAMTSAALALSAAAFAADMPDPGAMGGIGGMGGMGGAPMPAAVIVEQMHAMYTVAAIDPATRMITLKTPDNIEVRCTAGSEVRNFDQIKVGDHVSASLVDEVAVYVGKAGAQPTAGVGGVVALAPKGAKPGVFTARTEDISAKIVGIDPDKRMVTLEGPMGRDKTIQISPSVDLSSLKKGDEVTARWTRALAIKVTEAPAGEAMPAAARMPGETQQPGMPGAMIVSETSADFTVQAIDADKHMVTLKATDGATFTCMAGKEVRNFDQIKVGDQVHAVMVDELAVSVRKADMAPAAGAGEGEMVSLAPKGEKPGMVMAKTDQLTAKIIGIDTSRRLLTLEGPMGRDKIIKAGPNVNLAELQKGDQVVVQWTQAMAIDVQPAEASARPAGGMMPGMMEQPGEKEKN